MFVLFSVRHFAIMDKPVKLAKVFGHFFLRDCYFRDLSISWKSTEIFVPTELVFNAIQRYAVIVCLTQFWKDFTLFLEPPKILELN